jgi:hypothetical protein
MTFLSRQAQTIRLLSERLEQTQQLVDLICQAVLVVIVILLTQLICLLVEGVAQIAALFQAWAVPLLAKVAVLADKVVNILVLVAVRVLAAAELVVMVELVVVVLTDLAHLLHLQLLLMEQWVAAAVADRRTMTLTRTETSRVLVVLGVV